MRNQQIKQVTAFAPVLNRSGVLQRKCDCGNHMVAGGECADCAKKKNGLQRKVAIGAGNDPFEQEADHIADQILATRAQHPVNGTPPRIQRYATQAIGQTDIAPASVERVLAGSGRPLEPDLRQEMEQRFVHDFSRVRVHSGAAAEQSAQELNARAYTVGHNIVFGAGRFDPGKHEGRRLIAHELTHVVQQMGTEGVRVGQSNQGSGPSPATAQRAPLEGSSGRRNSSSTLPYREAKNLADCIRIMGPASTQYCRREVLGEEDVPGSPAPTGGSSPSSSGAFGSGKTGRILRMETLRDCAYTVTYANPRKVDCNTIWRSQKGTTPPSDLCGIALVYDITSVSAIGKNVQPNWMGSRYRK